MPGDELNPLDDELDVTSWFFFHRKSRVRENRKWLSIRHQSITGGGRGLELICLDSRGAGRIFAPSVHGVGGSVAASDLNWRSAFIEHGRSNSGTSE